MLILTILTISCTMCCVLLSKGAHLLLLAKHVCVCCAQMQYGFHGSSISGAMCVITGPSGRPTSGATLACDVLQIRCGHHLGLELAPGDVSERISRGHVFRVPHYTVGEVP